MLPSFKTNEPVNFTICANPLLTGIEIDDEQAEKIFTANDAVAFLSKELSVH